MNKDYVVIGKYRFHRKMFGNFAQLEANLFERDIEPTKLEGDDLKSYQVLLNDIKMSVMRQCKTPKDYLVAAQYIEHQTGAINTLNIGVQVVFEEKDEEKLAFISETLKDRQDANILETETVFADEEEEEEEEQ